MNRSKRPLSARDRKKMDKAIRDSQGVYPLKETRLYSDELTEKEMLKKFPKRVGKKQQAQLKAMIHGFIKKKNSHKKVSKRTTPGTVPSDSAPAFVHPEGKRWIQTLTKQALLQRTLSSNRGRKK